MSRESVKAAVGVTPSAELYDLVTALGYVNQDYMFVVWMLRSPWPTRQAPEFPATALRVPLRMAVAALRECLPTDGYALDCGPSEAQGGMHRSAIDTPQSTDPKA